MSATSGDYYTQEQGAAESIMPEVIEPVATAVTPSIEDVVPAIHSPLPVHSTHAQRTPLLRRQMQRYARRSLRQRRSSRLRPGLVLLLTILLLSLSMPLGITIVYGIKAYEAYDTLRIHANSGVQHLLNIKTILLPGGQHTDKNTGYALLDVNKLELAHTDLVAAQNDFVQMQSYLDHADLLQIVNQALPQYRPLLTTAHAATRIGIDITSVGQRLIVIGQTLAPRLQGSLLSATSTPLLVPSDIALFQSTLEQIQPSLLDILSQAQTLSVDALPISAAQHMQLRQYLALLPQVTRSLNAMPDLINVGAWLLGIDQPRTFLVQTMDRAELRATGGFTGQYGELQINGGRVAPFSLTNIALLEYSAGSLTFGQEPPAAYRSWWPFANWGLRDSNLSADFPTSAQLAIAQYKHETDHQVDGVITFTPTTIEHVLLATGPISIPAYQETITAQNLEARLHYYQLDHDGIVKEKAITHVEDDEQARKQFTSTLTHTLIDHFRHASLNELSAVGRQMLADLQTRNLQIYFTNPQLETLLTQNNLAGQLDRSSSHDGLYIVQMNVSVSKASQYVQNLFQDTVTLDAQGGATHALQIHLIYNQTGPIYGDDPYRDYIRIYVPPTAHFIAGRGFNQGSDAVSCRSPLSEVEPASAAGPPTNMHSDEPERGMFAGYVIIPKDCSATINVSWYVPPATSEAHNAYSLLVQRQAGTTPDLELAIIVPRGHCAPQSPPFTFHNSIMQDILFAPDAGQKSC